MNGEASLTPAPEKINAEFPGLDERSKRVHKHAVQTMIIKRLIALACVLAGLAAAQDPAKAPAPRHKDVAPIAGVPPEVVASAVAAVEKLGRDVTRGDFKAAVERMNPQWLEQLAQEIAGGEEAIRKQIAGSPTPAAERARIEESARATIRKQIEGAAQRMAQEGVSIVSSVPLGPPQGQPHAFEVQPGKRIEKINGEETEILVFTKWLVTVPTVTTFRILVKGSRKPVYVEKIGFQVAVADKGKDNWTFIDGSKLTVSALRRVYATLPKDLRLPPIEEREASPNR
jgi:hypothetical protein